MKNETIHAYANSGLIDVTSLFSHAGITLPYWLHDKISKSTSLNSLRQEVSIIANEALREGKYD